MAFHFSFWASPYPYTSCVPGTIYWLLPDYSLWTIFLVRIFQFDFSNKFHDIPPCLIGQFKSPMTIVSFDLHNFSLHEKYVPSVWRNRYLLSWQSLCIFDFSCFICCYHTQFQLFIFNICLVLFQFSIKYIVIFP